MVRGASAGNDRAAAGGTGVAGFARLYYAVTILVDPAYRDQFIDSFTDELRGTFDRRSEYLDLLRQRGDVHPDERRNHG